MKKVLLIASFALLSTPIFAQEEPAVDESLASKEETSSEQVELEEKTRFGVKAGYSSTAVDLGIISLSVDGFYAGVLAEFNATDKIIIQPELLYSRAAEANIIHAAGFAKYYVVEKLSLMAGPQITYFIGEDVDDESFGIDLAVGAAFDLTDNFFADLKYAYGLNKRGDDSFIPYRVNTFQLGVGYKF